VPGGGETDRSGLASAGGGRRRRGEVHGHRPDRRGGHARLSQSRSTGGTRRLGLARNQELRPGPSRGGEGGCRSRLASATVTTVRSVGGPPRGAKALEPALALLVGGLLLVALCRLPRCREVASPSPLVDQAQGDARRRWQRTECSQKPRALAVGEVSQAGGPGGGVSRNWSCPGSPERLVLIVGEPSKVLSRARRGCRPGDASVIPEAISGLVAAPIARRPEAR